MVFYPKVSFSRKYYINCLLLFIIILINQRYAQAEVDPLVEFSKLYVNPTAESYAIKKVAFLPFNNLTDFNDAGEIIGTLLMSEFENRGKYDFIESQKIIDIINTKGFTPEALTQYTTALELGRLLNADGVIIGSVSEYGFRGTAKEKIPAIGFSTRLIDVATGEVVWSFIACNENSIKGALFGVASKVVGEVVNNLTSEWITKGDIFAFGIHLEDLSAVKSLSRIKLFWPDNPHPSRKEYILYRGAAAEGPFKEIVRLPAQGEKKKTFFIDKDILPNISCYYQYSLTTLHGLETPKSKYVKSSTSNTPMAPTGVQARGDMLRKIQLSWNPNPEPEIDGYKIYRGLSIDGAYQIIDKVDEDTLTYIDQRGLSDDTTYYYKISAYYDRKREGDLSEPAAATTKGTPSPPTGLTGRSDLFRKVILTWDVHSDVEVIGYNIYRGLSFSGSSESIGKVAGREKTNYVDDGNREKPLGDKVTYYYAVTAYYIEDGKESEKSAATSATTLAPPAVPTGLKALGGRLREILLAWDTNQKTETKGYKIYRSLAEKGPYSLIDTVDERDKNSYSDTGTWMKSLADNQTYYYKITAYYDNGLESQKSVVAMATTKPLPQKPTGLKLSKEPDGVVLKWNSNPEKDIAGYNIYRSKWLLFGEKIGNTTNTSFKDSQVEAGKTYEYQITAYDKDGLESENSAKISITIPDEAP